MEKHTYLCTTNANMKNHSTPGILTSNIKTLHSHEKEDLSRDRTEKEDHHLPVAISMHKL